MEENEILSSLERLNEQVRRFEHHSTELDLTTSTTLLSLVFWLEHAKLVVESGHGSEKLFKAMDETLHNIETLCKIVDQEDELAYQLSQASFLSVPASAMGKKRPRETGTMGKEEKYEKEGKEEEEEEDKEKEQETKEGEAEKNYQLIKKQKTIDPDHPSWLPIDVDKKRILIQVYPLVAQFLSNRRWASVFPLLTRTIIVREDLLWLNELNASAPCKLGDEIVIGIHLGGPDEQSETRLIVANEIKDVLERLDDTNRKFYVDGFLIHSPRNANFTDGQGEYAMAESCAFPVEDGIDVLFTHYPFSNEENGHTKFNGETLSVARVFQAYFESVFRYKPTVGSTPVHKIRPQTYDPSAHSHHHLVPIHWQMQTSRYKPVMAQLLRPFATFVNVDRWVGSYRLPVIWDRGIAFRLADRGRELAKKQGLSPAFLDKPLKEHVWAAYAIGWLKLGQVIGELTRDTLHTDRELRTMGLVTLKLFGQVFSHARLRKIFSNENTHISFIDCFHKKLYSKALLLMNRTYEKVLIKYNFNEQDYPTTTWHDGTLSFREADQFLTSQCVLRVHFLFHREWHRMVIARQIEIDDVLGDDDGNQILVWSARALKSWKDNASPSLFPFNAALKTTLREIGLTRGAGWVGVCPTSHAIVLADHVNERVDEEEDEYKQLDSEKKQTWLDTEMARQYRYALTDDMVPPLIILRIWNADFLRLWLGKGWDWLVDGVCQIDPLLDSRLLSETFFVRIADPDIIDNHIRQEVFQDLATQVRAWDTKKLGYYRDKDTKEFMGPNRHKEIQRSNINRLFVEEMKFMTGTSFYPQKINIWTHRSSGLASLAFFPIWLTVWYQVSNPDVVQESGVSIDELPKTKRRTMKRIWRGRVQRQAAVSDKHKMVEFYGTELAYLYSAYTDDLSHYDQVHTDIIDTIRFGQVLNEMAFEFISLFVGALTNLIRRHSNGPILFFDTIESKSLSSSKETLDIHTEEKEIESRLSTHTSLVSTIKGSWGKKQPATNKILLFWFECVTNSRLYHVLRLFHVLFLRSSTAIWERFLTLLFRHGLNVPVGPLQTEYQGICLVLDIILSHATSNKIEEIRDLDMGDTGWIPLYDWANDQSEWLSSKHVDEKEDVTEHTRSVFWTGILTTCHVDMESTDKEFVTSLTRFQTWLKREGTTLPARTRAQEQFDRDSVTLAMLAQKLDEAHGRLLFVKNKLSGLEADASNMPTTSKEQLEMEIAKLNRAETEIKNDKEKQELAGQRQMRLQDIEKWIHYPFLQDQLQRERMNLSDAESTVKRLEHERDVLLGSMKPLEKDLPLHDEDDLFLKSGIVSASKWAHFKTNVGTRSSPHAETRRTHLIVKDQVEDIYPRPIEPRPFWAFPLVRDADSPDIDEMFVEREGISDRSIDTWRNVLTV